MKNKNSYFKYEKYKEKMNKELENILSILKVYNSCLKKYDLPLEYEGKKEEIIEIKSNDNDKFVFITFEKENKEIKEIFVGDAQERESAYSNSYEKKVNITKKIYISKIPKYLFDYDLSKRKNEEIIFNNNEIIRKLEIELQEKSNVINMAKLTNIISEKTNIWCSCKSEKEFKQCLKYALDSYINRNVNFDYICYSSCKFLSQYNGYEEEKHKNINIEKTIEEFKNNIINSKNKIENNKYLKETLIYFFENLEKTIFIFEKDEIVNKYIDFDLNIYKDFILFGKEKI